MSLSKPVPYEAQKSILSFMDPMVRLEFAQRCLSIRNVNKLIPQKFEYFETDESCFEVNQTVIRMGIIKLYKNGKTPKWIMDENRDGGSHVDLDRYGLSYRFQFGRDAEYIGFIKECLKKHSMTEIEKARKLEELAARKLRKDQKEPPFEQFLQVEFFEKSKNSGDLKLKNREFLVCDGNRIIKKAREYLSKKIFGEAEKIDIKTFEIGPNIMERAGMGPNPHPKRSFYFGDFSIKAEQLRIESLIINNATGNSLIQLRPFLDPNHRIKRIFLNENLPETDPIIQKNDFLIINSNYMTIFIWNRLTNRKIHLPKASFCDFSVRRVWESWRMEQPEIGRVWSVGFEKEEKMKGILTCFGKIEQAEERGTRLYLPINDQSEMMIWGEETMENDKEWCKSKWIVKIEVMARNSVKRKKYF
ncbi:hypothetical protein L3Y34_019632 [Caenorhabditis briggsae]|uniref:F-box domain-containing protein n=1 Tax=Caenorhabditis briggsae TaxID=6238 RepID=A0AAE9DRD4_CAEBR|nr:hypothetical protein L3Y34_019632 [Caenorhabditis briggsae]